MNQHILESSIGALVLLVALFFGLFAYKHSHSNDPSGYILSASFEKADGLVIGGDVKISGIKVGKIKSLALDPQSFTARATVSIDPAIKLPVDSSAEVASEGIMGGKHLVLMPGSQDEILPSGGTITHTQSAVSLESLIGQLIFSNKANDKK